jgi:NAD-dependent dihydropyrimidine dehydrogenase PreA subunit
MKRILSLLFCLATVHLSAQDCDYEVNIELNDGGNADTYTWLLYDDNTNTLIESMPDEENVFNWFYCLEDGCYRVEMSGQGYNGGMHVEVNEVIVGQELFNNEGVEMLYFSVGDATCVNSEGCTDSEALNYDPSAGIDDGSCQYDCEENLVEVSTLTGSLPEFLTWSVYSSDGDLVANSSEYDTWHELHTEWYCMEDGCYYVSMSSSDEYPWDVPWNGGQLSFSMSGESLLHDSLHLFGPSIDYAAFGVNTSGCEAVPGCTQPDAPNYNPEANINDGSCEDGFGPGGPMYSLTSQEPVYFSQLTPNPGGARSTLILEGLDSEQETFVSLTTLSGQVVYQQVIAAGSTTIREELDLSDLATGLYLFKVEHAGKTSVERWMKR